MAKLLVGEPGITLSALEPRIPWRFTGRPTSKDGVGGAVPPGEPILHHLAVESAVLRPDFLESGKVGALTGQRATDTTLLPGLFALFQSGIVEFSATAQHTLPHLLLFWSRLELVLVGSAHPCCVHLTLCCLIADKMVNPWVIHPLAQAKGLSVPFYVTPDPLGTMGQSVSSPTIT